MTDRPTFPEQLPDTGPTAGWSVLLVKLSLAASAAEVQQLAGLLSAAEQERSARRLPEVRRRAITSRGRLRQLLGRLLDAPPAAIELETGPQGKPTLAGRFSGLLEFNVSHSGDEGLIAISRRGPVGIDLEVAKPTQAADWARLMAGTIFAADELVRWQQLPEPQLAAAVLDAWVAKEAVFKAIGTGIGDRLRHCVLPAELPRAVLSWSGGPTVCQLVAPELRSADGSADLPPAVTLLELGPGRHTAFACRAETVWLTVRSLTELLGSGSA